MSFLSRGADKVDQDIRDLNDRKEKMNARRFWMKSGTSVNVVFLDEDFIRFEEYRVFNNRGRPDFFTRPPQGQTDRFLHKGLRPEVKYAFSIIDCSKWTDQKGQVHQNEKKLLIVNAEFGKMLSDKKKNWGGLKGKAVRITRKGEKDYSHGSDFELLLKDGQPVVVNMKAFKDVVPFDYEKVLSPVGDDDAIRALANMKSQNGSAVSLEGDDNGEAFGESGLPGSEAGDPGPSAPMDDSGSDLPF